MKFKTYPKFSIVRYTIELELLLSSCIDLLLDVIHLDVKNKEEKFANIFSYRNEYNSDVDSLTTCLITTIINDIENEIISQNLIKEILFWDLKNKTILIKNNTNIRNVLNNLIKQAEPIKKLFGYVSQPYQSLSCKLLELNPYKYGGYSIDVVTSEMSCPILPITWLANSGNLYPIDSDGIYISNVFLDLLKVKEDEFVIHEWHLDNNDAIQGYVINDRLIPLCDITSHVSEISLPYFYFDMIENVFSKEGQGYLCHKPENFREDAKNNDFVKILGNLECNFYLKDDTLISDRYMHYFEKVVSVDSLKHFQNTHIYTNSNVDASNTLLGIYTSEKINNNFHLIHWISRQKDGDLYNHYHTDLPMEYQAKMVYALKPEYSFYFVRKYFEDILELVLKELNVRYLLNRSLASSTDHQVDAILVANNKLLILEAKTRLSVKTIEDSIKKAERLYPIWQETFPNALVEYITIAQFSDDVIGAIKYFLHENAKHIDAETGLFAYDFDIKLTQFENFKIKFVSEPTYAKLKGTISKLIYNDETTID